MTHEPVVPDIAAMSARERADRLYNRVMRSADIGAQDTVEMFAPMALQAYDMLSANERDADAHFHMGLVHLNVGDAHAAAAHADTIAAIAPGHLFASALRIAIARRDGPPASLRAALAAYRAAAPAELARNLPEYADHVVLLDQLKVEAAGQR